MATKKSSTSKSSKKSGGTLSLKAAIESAGYSWAAGQTSVSQLSAAEQEAHLGLVVDQKELQATERAILAAEQFRAFTEAFAAPPPAIDWRNKSGDWTTPIKNQASCGSCVSFGTCATIEARINIACNNPNMDVDLSEAHLFYCGCGNCCGTGWNFPPALDFAKNTGVGLETSFPYTPGNQPCKTGVTPYIKITNWSAVLPVADRKNVIATKGPMVAGMAVYQDFYSYHSGVYKHVTGQLVGYHCISVVGYDDSQKCWICKNSWGTGWGESGFFRIGYGECGIDTQFAFYDVDLKCPSPGPTPTDNCERYIPALKRVLEAARLNPSLRLCLRYYVCGKLPRPQCSAAILNVVRAVLLILRECPKYREPFCRALG